MISGSRHRFTVSDHAIVRWLDRTQRIGVEAVRDRLGGVGDPELLFHLASELRFPIADITRRILRELFDQDAPQNGQVTVGEAVFVIRDGFVVTTLDRKPEPRPTARLRGPGRKATKGAPRAASNERGGNRSIAAFD
ncbi:hypothetical protein [Aureimonas sp. SK2]|uniref:hypothetical protein n=1 Tax=Aureimonas sp. SK2 TaxID=3015992 RepID=UPI002443E3F7|nr:hypothetical protein [Aureimonas sp. SK2]